jgi:acyl-CoA thioester hydrolase
VQSGVLYTLMANDAKRPLNVHYFRVRPHQTDLNGAMYHGAYLDIFDEARIETFRSMGYAYEDLLRDGCAAVIRHVTCDFQLPALMDELLSVTVTIARQRPASLRIRYECRRGEQALVRAEVEFAFIGVNGRPQRVPARLREVIDQNRETFGIT